MPVSYTHLALFLIDDATYLHIQPCDSGWDYTIYDAASMKELDGSPDIHVDIYIIEPTRKRNYYTLITSGMGAHRMNVPHGNRSNHQPQ